MQTRCDHTQQEVGPIILHCSSKHLLLSRDHRRPFDALQGMDRGANAQIADTLGNNTHAVLVGRACTFLSVLDWHLGETNVNGTDIASKDIAPIERLSGSDCIIKTFKVDCKKRVQVTVHDGRDMSTH